MFFRKDSEVELEGAALLESRLAEHMPAADAGTVSICTAIAGLLASVAYADGDYDEESKIRELLGSMQGLTSIGVDAVLSVLRKHIREIHTIQGSRYTRCLVDLADRDLRFHILEMLVEVAAADGTISFDEVTYLRRTANALALTKDDYNRLQAKYRDKLGSLRSSHPPSKA